MVFWCLRRKKEIYASRESSERDILQEDIKVTQ